MDTDQIDDEIAALTARIAALEAGSTSTAEAEQVAAFNASNDFSIAFLQKQKVLTYAQQVPFCESLTAAVNAYTPT